MIVSDFQNGFNSAHAVAHVSSQAFNSAGSERLMPQSNTAELSSSATTQRSPSGFLAQSVDDIARLYVESPFSW